MKKKNARITGDPVKIRIAYISDTCVGSQPFHQPVQFLLNFFRIYYVRHADKENCGHSSPTAFAPKQAVRYKLFISSELK
jgi:hypothetical protein